MSTLTIPPAGITITHPQAGPNSQPQLVRIRLSGQDARELIKHVRDGESARLRTGRYLAVDFGNKHLSVRHSVENHPQEIFTGPLDGSKPMYFTGKLGHSLEVMQAREAVSGADSALEKLRNNLKQSHEDRSTQESSAMNNKFLKHGQKPSPLSGGLLGSRNSSPYLNAGFSPRHGPTSAPLLPGQSQSEKIKLDAIKIPTIHLLAMEPQDPAVLARKLRVKRADLDQVLAKVAREGKGSKKELKDRAYRDLDVWKFPYPSQGDRQFAIDNAISAYDRMRIEKTDNSWQMLLAKEDRGKGIFLSKLNFDRPLPAGNLTPKLAERSADGTSTEGKSMNSLTSGDSSRKGKATAPKTTEKPKLTTDQIARNLKKMGQSVAKETSKSASSLVRDNKKVSSAKVDPKFKSSEKVIDSDEEAQTGPSVPAASNRRKEQPASRTVRNDRPLTTTSKAPLHKPHLSGSSGSGDVDRGRLSPASAMVQTRGGKNTAEPALGGRPSNPSQARNISRSRTGSSPAKPSPLGSSPPSKQRDADTSSNSSKGTSLSSAPSSPPSTAESSQGKRVFSPNVTAQKSAKKDNSLKRKADTHDAIPAGKKQLQANGIHAPKKDNSRFNVLPAKEDLESRPALRRENSESDSSSTSTESSRREQLVKDAKNFQKWYGKYKDLYEKISRQKDSERKDEDVDHVWSMHKRLAEMKSKIWNEWERLEKAKR